jgi:hypothetical protein
MEIINSWLKDNKSGLLMGLFLLFSSIQMKAMNTMLNNRAAASRMNLMKKRWEQQEQKKNALQQELFEKKKADMRRYFNHPKFKNKQFLNDTIDSLKTIYVPGNEYYGAFTEVVQEMTGQKQSAVQEENTLQKPIHEKQKMMSDIERKKNLVSQEALEQELENRVKLDKDQYFVYQQKTTDGIIVPWNILELSQVMRNMLQDVGGDDSMKRFIPVPYSVEVIKYVFDKLREYKESKGKLSFPNIGLDNWRLYSMDGNLSLEDVLTNNLNSVVDELNFIFYLDIQSLQATNVLSFTEIFIEKMGGIIKAIMKTYCPIVSQPPFVETMTSTSWLRKNKWKINYDALRNLPSYLGEKLKKWLLDDTEIIERATGLRITYEQCVKIFDHYETTKKLMKKNYLESKSLADFLDHIKDLPEKINECNKQRDAKRSEWNQQREDERKVIQEVTEEKKKEIAATPWYRRWF